MLAAGLSMILSPEALAGRNSGGALVVHTDPATSYTAGMSYCGMAAADPSNCTSARTRADVAGGGAVIIWVLAAFPDASSPGVSVVQFGIEMSGASVLAHGPCPTDAVAIPGSGFPGPSSGVSVGFLPIYDTLFPFYWFAVQGSSGDRFGTARDPDAGRAVFVDDSASFEEDEISRFGHVTWGSDGANECPNPIEVRSADWGKIKDSYR
jgi:hypothetical protein